MANVPQIRIPATYMRGGTSKGVFFRLQDLPAKAQSHGAAPAIVVAGGLFTVAIAVLIRD